MDRDNSSGSFDYAPLVLYGDMPSWRFAQDDTELLIMDKSIKTLDEAFENP